MSDAMQSPCPTSVMMLVAFLYFSIPIIAVFMRKWGPYVYAAWGLFTILELILMAGDPHA